MKRSISPIVMMIGLISFALASYGMRELLAWWHREEPASSVTIPDSAWIEQRIGDFVFEAPWSLRTTSKELPPETKPLIVSTTWVDYVASDVALSATMLTYRAGFGVDLDAAADGAIARMRTVANTLAVEPRKAEAWIDGLRAIDEEATIRRHGGPPLVQRAVLFATDNDLYIIMLIVPANLAGGIETWNRVRASVHRVGMSPSR